MTGEVYDRDKEIREAEIAGQRALSSLREADRQLGSARNWGLVDIFGGDMISGLFKHMKVNNASQCVEQAKRELGDVRGIENMNVDVGGFLTFADFFFDGLIADVWVQSKINDSRRQVQEAISRVEYILRQLKAYY